LTQVCPATCKPHSCDEWAGCAPFTFRQPNSTSASATD
jgi:hypothetical protein